MWPVGIGLLAIGLLLVAIQLIPYGRRHDNPPVVREPPWSTPEIRALAVRACFDCHSNETRWPWYSHVAPVSWLVQRDVDEGRRLFNVSEWQRPQPEALEAAETVIEGQMPPWHYVVLHPAASLMPAERERLLRGLEDTFGR